jgi:hypothetical protein
MSKALSSLAALRATAAGAQSAPAPIAINAPAAVATQPVSPPPAPAPLPAVEAHDPALMQRMIDPAPPALETNRRTRKTPIAGSREGLVSVTIHMRPEGRRVLKQLAAETDLSVEELGRMAFNMLLTHYQKPRLI